MVMTRNRSRSERGALEVDMLAALLLLFVAVLPLGYSFYSDQRAMRAGYERAVAMELLDGEMERLVAGSDRNLPPGTNEITLAGNAATNLHPATARRIVGTNSIRLEWTPVKHARPTVVREVKRP